MEYTLLPFRHNIFTNKELFIYSTSWIFISDKVIQWAILSCSLKIMIIFFYTGQPSFILLSQVDLSFLGDFSGMKGFINYWSGWLTSFLSHVCSISFYSYFLLLRVLEMIVKISAKMHTHTKLFKFCVSNVDQALGCPYMFGYSWTLVRSDEYWWLDSTRADFGCWSSKVSQASCSVKYRTLQ